MIRLNLRIGMIALAVILLITILMMIRKGKLPIKYSLFWLLSDFAILLVGIFPEFVGSITRLIGFETTSNMVIGVILILLLVITLLLTMIISHQKQQITLLVQEISMLKSNIERRKK